MTLDVPFIALIKREVLSNLRRTRSMIFMAVFVAACCILVITVWPRETGAIMNARRISGGLLDSFSTLMLVLGTFMLPGLGAASVTVERETNTYEQLRLTLFSTRSIVFAKLVNIIGFFVLALAAAVPVMSVALLLVGLDFAELLINILVILVHAFVCTSVGVLSGALFRKSITATMCAYLGMGIFLAGALGLLYALGFIQEVWDFSLASLYGPPLDMQTTAFLCYALLFATGCLALATGFIHRQGTADAAVFREKTPNSVALKARRKRFPYYLIDPLERRAPIGDLQNPILVRELRWGMTPRATRTIRNFYIATFLLCGTALLLTSPEALLPFSQQDDGLKLFVMIQFGLVLLLGPLLMAPGLTKEHERGNIDMLRTTLLAPYQILDGKLAAGLLELAPLLLAMVISGFLAFLMTVVSGRSPGLIIACYPTLAVSLWVSLCAGLFAALMTRRTGIAIILSYGGTLILLGGALGCAVIVDMMTSGTMRRFPDFLWFLSPVTAYAYCVTKLGTWGLTSLLGWLVCLVVFFLIGCVLRDAAVLYFNYRCMYDR